MQAAKHSSETLPVPDQLIRNTCRIVTSNSAGKSQSGSAFSFRVPVDAQTYAPILITNRHVLENMENAKIWLTLLDETGSSKRQVICIPFSNVQAAAVYHPNSQIDLAALPLADIEINVGKLGKKIDLLALTPETIARAEVLNDCRALEPVLMVGYPNGIWDSKNNRPVLRAGTTATPIFEEYNGEPKFLIDCPCFPGSSGSPVFLYNEGTIFSRSGNIEIGRNRVALIGILHAVFLHTADGKVIDTPIANLANLKAEIAIPNSIGICIKATEIMALLDVVRTRAATALA